HDQRRRAPTGSRRTRWPASRRLTTRDAATEDQGVNAHSSRTGETGMLPKPREKSGGAEGNRTLDLLNAMPAVERDSGLKPATTRSFRRLFSGARDSEFAAHRPPNAHRFAHRCGA